MISDKTKQQLREIRAEDAREFWQEYTRLCGRFGMEIAPLAEDYFAVLPLTERSPQIGPDLSLNEKYGAKPGDVYSPPVRDPSIAFPKKLVNMTSWKAPTLSNVEPKKDFKVVVTPPIAYKHPFLITHVLCSDNVECTNVKIGWRDCSPTERLPAVLPGERVDFEFRVKAPGQVDVEVFMLEAAEPDVSAATLDSVERGLKDAAAGRVQPLDLSTLPEDD